MHTRLDLVFASGRLTVCSPPPVSLQSPCAHAVVLACRRRHAPSSQAKLHVSAYSQDLQDRPVSRPTINFGRLNVAAYSQDLQQRPEPHARQVGTLAEGPQSKFSAEFKRGAALQLRLLHTALKGVSGPAQQFGQFSVFVRTPESFDHGELALQRVACLSNADGDTDGTSQFDESTTLVQLRREGAPETEHVIEDWLIHQRSFELPDTDAVVFPLTFVAHPSVTLEGQTDSSLLGLMVVEAPSLPAAGSSTVSQQTTPLEAAQQSEVLEQSCECLTMTCALELRAALERAALLASQQHARSLVEKARKPLSALRTFGTMLSYRVAEGRPESDLTSGIVVQGDQLHSVLQQLQHALHPIEQEDSHFAPQTRILSAGRRNVIDESPHS